MLRETSQARKRKARRVKYRGIVAHARALGVSRIHLYKVLSGRRSSLRLLARYHHLRRSQSP